MPRGDSVNVERVRRWLVAHPGGTQKECAAALDLAVMTVNRAVKKIRASWLDVREENS